MASPPVKLKLRSPIQWGKEAPPIEELTLKFSARAFKEFSLPMTGDGKIDYQPYKLAQVGLQMAGHPPAMVDKIEDPEDFTELAQLVMGFFVGGQTAGPTP